MKRLVVFLFLAIAWPAYAEDDKAPEPPYTPPMPPAPGALKPAPGAPVQLSADDLEALVDKSVRRAMAAQASAQREQAMSSPQREQAQASPQQPQQAMYTPQPAIYQPQPVMYVQQAASAPPSQTVQVLVPAHPVHQMMAKWGEHLVSKGQPRIKTVTLAAPVATTMVAAPVAVAPVQYTPAQAVYNPPQPATYTPPLPTKNPPRK